MTYVFGCEKCKTEVDKEMSVQEYTDTKHNQVCEKCGGLMVRVWTPILRTEYKCQGFYDTDNRGKTGR